MGVYGTCHWFLIHSTDSPYPNLLWCIILFIPCVMILALYGMRAVAVRCVCVQMFSLYCSHCESWYPISLLTNIKSLLWLVSTLYHYGCVSLITLSLPSPFLSFFPFSPFTPRTYVCAIHPHCSPTGRSLWLLISVNLIIPDTWEAPTLHW